MADMLRALPFGRFICEQVAINLPGKFWKGFCGTKHVYRRNPHGCFASVRYGDNALLPRHILKYVRKGCLYFFVIDNIRHRNTLLRLKRIYCSTFYSGHVWGNRQNPWLSQDPTVSPPSGAPCAVRRPRLSRPAEGSQLAATDGWMIAPRVAWRAAILAAYDREHHSNFTSHNFQKLHFPLETDRGMGYTCFHLAPQKVR